MKLKKMKLAINVFMCAVFVLISCQEEERELINPDDTIPKDSQLAELMKNVVTHDGSFDDLVDKGNCYSINLPYTVLINGEEMTIDHMDDYNQIYVSDDIKIQFPITITTHEYMKEYIETDKDLEALASLCQEEDDDIECIDFVYPIRINTFNSNTNTLSTIEVIHDAQVYEFMADAGDHIVMSISYPIQLLLHNGEHTTSGHNEQLRSTILNFDGSCDENDG